MKTPFWSCSKQQNTKEIKCYYLLYLKINISEFRLILLDHITYLLNDLRIGCPISLSTHTSSFWNSPLRFSFRFCLFSLRCCCRKALRCSLSSLDCFCVKTETKYMNALKITMNRCKFQHYFCLYPTYIYIFRNKFFQAGLGSWDSWKYTCC